MRVIFIGDIIGDRGRKILRYILPGIMDKFKPNFIIANGENAAGGFGITPKIADELFTCGIDVITSGNHIWDKKDIYSYLDSDKPILRPANYPEGVYGKGMVSVTKNGKTIYVINLQGRTFMNPLIDCPFKTADLLLSKVDKKADAIIVDFHAEATSEKRAITHYLNGRVTAVIGTHTHVPTADAETTQLGTAYITDVGMTGSVDSVIGFRSKEAINRFLYGIPSRFKVGNADNRLCGVVIDIEKNRAKSITQLILKDNSRIDTE